MNFFWAVGFVALLVIGVHLVRRIIDWVAVKEFLWRGTAPHPVPITFLNGGMAVRPVVLGHSVPEGYRLACAFFGVGLLDRTGTLNHGFEPKIFDPIPSDFKSVADMPQLCADRATEIVKEAREDRWAIRLLWSGGIDSTCVAVALLNELGDDLDRLEVFYSDASITEYRKFYRMLKKRKVKLVKISAVSEALTTDALIVTGEHGDQIFGSMLAENVLSSDLRSDWKTVLPGLLVTKLGNKGAEVAFRYLEPQVAASPIPIVTTYDYLWWANFSMKWQTVSQRILATVDTATRNAVEPQLRHFFRTDDFQRWALANPEKKIRDNWPSYKYPLKDIIYEFNGDRRYRDRKEKERSLRGLTGRLSRRALAIDEHGELYTQGMDRSILPAFKRMEIEISRDWE